jgi:hypothetical protein
MASPSRFTVGPCLGRAVFRYAAGRDNCLTIPTHPLVGFGLPSEVHRTSVVPCAVLRLTTGPLSWAFAPYNTCRRPGSTGREACRASLRSAFRVWLPSGRFSPPDAWLSLFHLNSVLGIVLSGASPPPRSATSSLATSHPPVVLAAACSEGLRLQPVQRPATPGLCPSLTAPAGTPGFNRAPRGKLP